MRVLVKLGRQFARQAAFAERAFELPEGARASHALAALAAAAPSLDCVDARRKTVDLAVASLSINGRPVDPRAPEIAPLREGDVLYLFGAVSGG